MKLKCNRRYLPKIAILLVISLASIIIFTGCVQGLQPIGWSGVAVTDSTIYVGSMEGRLVSFNISSNVTQWSEPLKSTQSGGLGSLGCSSEPTNVAIYGIPVLFNDLAIIGGYNGKIVAYVAASLQQRWIYPLEGNLKAVVSGMAVDSTNLYFGDSDGKVYALDAQFGGQKWSFTTGAEVWSTPVVVGNQVFVGSFDKKVYCLDAATGSKIWERTLGGAIAATPLVQGDIVYVGSFDRNMYALNRVDGSIKWQFESGNWFWARPILSNNVLYAPSLDSKVYALDSGTGAKINEVDMGNPVASSPVLVNNQLIVATMKNADIYSVNISDFSKLLLANVAQNIGITAALSTYNNIVYVHVAEKTAIYRINAATGAQLSAIPLKKPS